MKIKQAIKFLVLVFFTTCCLSTAKATEKEKYTLNIATFAAQRHPIARTIIQFKNNLEFASNNRFKVNYFINNKLGNEDRILKLANEGELQIVITGTQSKRYDQNIQLSDIPYLIKNWEEASACYDNKALEILSGKLEEKSNLKMLALFVNGFRVVSANKDLKELKDLEGLKMRVPYNYIHENLFKSLNTTTTVVPLSLLYNALEVGSVNAQENPYTTILSSGLYEVQNSILETNHIFAISPVIINKNYFEGLPKDLQEILLETIQKAQQFNWSLSQSSEYNSKLRLIKHGMRIYNLKDADRKILEDKATSLYEEIIRKNPDAKIWIEHCKKNISKLNTKQIEIE